jgi:hypothetical protein
VARSAAGKLVPLIKANHEYLVDGEPITVVGIADRTVKATPAQFNKCLQDDSENQIDIVLKGSEAAMRKLIAVRLPAQGNGYRPLYNDGGPGSTPQAGVRYTAPTSDDAADQRARQPAADDVHPAHHERFLTLRRLGPP